MNTLKDEIISARDALKPVSNKGVPEELRKGFATLDAAAALIEKGYGLDTEIAPLLERHRTVEAVPAKEKEKEKESSKK